MPPIFSGLPNKEVGSSFLSSSCYRVEDLVSCAAEVSSDDADFVSTVPPAILSSFPQQSANASESFSLSCSSAGTLPLEWMWLHNAQEVVTSSRVSIQSSGSVSMLTVSSLMEGDGGVYQCLVRQPATGREDTHSKLIIVRGKMALHL